MMKKISIPKIVSMAGIASIVGTLIFVSLTTISFLPSITYAQEATVSKDQFEIVKARVIDVLDEEMKDIAGTDVQALHQTMTVQILEGDKKDQVITVENDLIALKVGDKFFLYRGIDGHDGSEQYSVRDVDRRGPVVFFVFLFILVVLLFLGTQGVRSLIGLAGSFLVILYVLVPSLLNNYPPVQTSIVIGTVILFFAIFFTHGFNRVSAVAFAGTVLAVILTGVLAYVGVTFSHLTGFTSDESVYLNFNTRGVLDFAGLLLGGMIIGVLGVLDDIAVTQAAVVSELYSSAPHLSRMEIYKKALRVGKEHVGALVNTLALAYTGVSLPLILLFSTSESSMSSIVNQEIFATEIIRTVVGSIGLILTVPITTLLAVYMLKNYKNTHTHGHSHSHGHSHVHGHSHNHVHEHSHTRSHTHSH